MGNSAKPVTKKKIKQVKSKIEKIQKELKKAKHRKENCKACKDKVDLLKQLKAAKNKCKKKKLEIQENKKNLKKAKKELKKLEAAKTKKKPKTAKKVKEKKNKKTIQITSKMAAKPAKEIKTKVAAKVTNTKILSTTATINPPKANVAKRDDLKKIEGIGPKIELVLNEAGIVTFVQLSLLPAEKIKNILAKAGPRFKMHNPSTWPKQANLANKNRWEELKALQLELKGGKVVK